MDQIQKSRRNAIIKRDAILVGIGILYYIFIRVTGLAIPCIFRKITGFLFSYTMNMGKKSVIVLL